MYLFNYWYLSFEICWVLELIHGHLIVLLGDPDIWMLTAGISHKISTFVIVSSVLVRQFLFFSANTGIKIINHEFAVCEA